MTFLEMRKARQLTLEQAAGLADYSVAAINALELEGRGSSRLRSRLTEVYGFKDTAGVRQYPESSAEPAVLRDQPDPNRKLAVAKLRKQVQNMQVQIDAINETLNELDS